MGRSIEELAFVSSLVKSSIIDREAVDFEGPEVKYRPENFLRPKPEV